MAIVAFTDGQQGAQILVLTCCLVGGVFNISLIVAGLRSPQVRQIPLKTLMFFSCGADLLIQVSNGASLIVSLHTGTAPDSRPTFCHVQGIVSVFGWYLSLLAILATALSRYRVVCQNKHPQRRFYLYLIGGCIALALINLTPLLSMRVELTKDAGGLLCTPAWNRSDDPAHLYVIVSNVILGIATVVVALCCVLRCRHHIRTVTEAQTHSNATSWSDSSAKVQLTRLLAVTQLLALCMSILVAEILWAAITQQPVPAALDRCQVICITGFYSFFPVGMWSGNQTVRNAVIELLTCTRHASILPSHSFDRERHSSMSEQTMAGVMPPFTAPMAKRALGTRKLSSSLMTLNFPDSVRTLQLPSRTPSHHLTAAIDQQLSDDGDDTRSTHASFAMQYSARAATFARVDNSRCSDSPALQLCTAITSSHSSDQLTSSITVKPARRSVSSDDAVQHVTTMPSHFPQLHSTTTHSMPAGLPKSPRWSQYMSRTSGMRKASAPDALFMDAATAADVHANGLLLTVPIRTCSASS